MPIQRINEFPEGSGSLSNDDVFLFMDDPSSSEITKKISLSELKSIINEDSNVNINIPSNTGLVANSTSINNIVSISQTNYDALVTKDSNTLYVVISS